MYKYVKKEKLSKVALQKQILQYAILLNYFL